MKEFSHNSPYSYAENDVVCAIDRDVLGKEIIINSKWFL